MVGIYLVAMVMTMNQGQNLTVCLAAPIFRQQLYQFRTIPDILTPIMHFGQCRAMAEHQHPPPGRSCLQCLPYPGQFFIGIPIPRISPIIMAEQNQHAQIMFRYIIIIPERIRLTHCRRGQHIFIQNILLLLRRHRIAIPAEIRRIMVTRHHQQRFTQCLQVLQATAGHNRRFSCRQHAIRQIAQMDNAVQRCLMVYRSQVGHRIPPETIGGIMAVRHQRQLDAAGCCTHLPRRIGNLIGKATAHFGRGLLRCQETQDSIRTGCLTGRDVFAIQAAQADAEEAVLLKRVRFLREVRFVIVPVIGNPRCIPVIAVGIDQFRRNRIIVSSHRKGIAPIQQRQGASCWCSADDESSHTCRVTGTVTTIAHINGGFCLQKKGLTLILIFV